MAMNNLERRIRFSNCTVQEYKTLGNSYRQKAIPILMENKDFISLLESKGDGSVYLKPKAQIEREAKAFAEDENAYLKNLGNAILKFLANGAKDITEVLVAVDSILLTGGVILTTSITLIIALLLYAITVMPAALLRDALWQQEGRLWRHINRTDPDVMKYEYVVDNIETRDKDNNKQDYLPAVKDIHKFAKSIPVSEAISEIVHEASIYESITGELAEYCSIIEAIDTRLADTDNRQYSLIESELQIFGDLSPEGYHYQPSNSITALESVTGPTDDGTELFMTLENINKGELLSGEGLLEGAICIVTDACDKKSILDFFNTYRATAKYEFTHENYSDIPLLKLSGAVLEFVDSRCGDNTTMKESLQTLSEAFANIIDEAYDEVKMECDNGGPALTVATPSTTDVGFNPNPYDIGSLTPFPVAVRKIGSLMDTIIKAESDDEITEAMLQFGRVSSIINETYEVTGNDTDGYMILEANAAGKVARKAESKANQAFAKTATKDRTGGVKQAVKRTLDPMEKFIEKQYAIYKEKDANERRNIILKGAGPEQAAAKVMRWIKRGVGLLIGTAVGQLIPPVAIATGISFIAFIVTDKYLDNKERAKILRELEDEIQLVNEKIDDSRGDDNKQNKYELMRIRNQLTRTSEKIRLGLNY